MPYPYNVYDLAMERLGIFNFIKHNPLTHGYEYTKPDRATSLVSIINLNITNIEGKTVLEIGCGGGNVACRFAEARAKVYGFDRNKTLVDLAGMLSHELIEEDVFKKEYKPTFFQGEYIYRIFARRWWQKPFEFVMPYLTYILSSRTIKNMENACVKADDVDIWYSYPWLDEKRLMMGMFRHYAKKGALLAMKTGNKNDSFTQKSFPELQMHNASIGEFDFWIKT